MSGGGSSGGGGSSTTQTIQKADPWAGQQPYLTDIFQKAQAQYNSGTPQYYPGNVTAGVDPLTTAAQANLLANIPQTQALANTTNATTMFNMTDARYAEANPYLQSAIEAAIRPALNEFSDTGGTLSQIRAGATNAGQFGGTRQGIAEGLAADRLQQNVLDTASKMASQGYESGLDASTKALALAPQTASLLQTPSTMMDAVGQQRTAYEQQLINDAINQWNFNQNLDAAKLAQYQNLVQGNYGGVGTGTSTSTGGMQSNSLMSGLGMAATGYSLAPLLGLSGPVGAGIGAVLGLLM